MRTIGKPSENVKGDNVALCEEDDFEREHDGPEPECVRFILTQPVDKIGPTDRAAYGRLVDGHPADSEFVEVAKFGKWARGKKGKPFCLYVVSLVLGLQRFHDDKARREGKLAEGHGAFPISGAWVAAMLKKYGIRPDMTDGTRLRKVYDVLARLQSDTVGILRRVTDYSYTEHRAREFTARTVAELDAKPDPLPVVEPKPETPVAEIVEAEWKKAVAEGGDSELQLERLLSAIKAHAAHERPDSSRRRGFNRVAGEVREELCRVRRDRDKARDAIGCRVPRYYGIGAAFARRDTG